MYFYIFQAFSASFWYERGEGFNLKKLTAIFLAMLIVFSSGCGHTASGETTRDHSNTAAPEAIDDILTEDDFAIPEKALQWQERNAPIFMRDDFYDHYSTEKDGICHLDYRKAMQDIEIEVTYNREDEVIIITPKDELGPIMFQFTLYCVPVAEMRTYVCWEYLCEFMHTNSNHDEWCYFFSECELPDENTVYFTLDIDGEEFNLTQNVFFEVDTTIATMMSLEENKEELNNITFPEGDTKNI